MRHSLDASVWCVRSLHGLRLLSVGHGAQGKVDPGHAPVWQAWAIVEGAAGRDDKARELFARARQAQPTHLPTLQVCNSPLR